MMFDKLQHLSYSFYDQNSTGWLVSRITSDADRVTELISWGFVSVIWGFAMVIMSFSYMFILNWKLGLGVLLSMPVLLFVSMKIRLLILKYSRKARKQNSEMIAYVTEHINGVAVNKATVQEESAIEGYKRQTGKMHRYAFNSSLYTALYIPLIFLTGAFAAAFVIMYGGNLYIAKVISLGVWAAFLAMLETFLNPFLILLDFMRLLRIAYRLENVFSP